MTAPSGERTEGAESGECQSETGRRTFLRTLVGGGVGGPIAHALGVEEFRFARRDTQIVYGYARDDPDTGTASTRPRTRTVPAAWFEDLQRAFDRHARLLGAEIDGLVGADVVPGDIDDVASSLRVDVLADRASHAFEGITDVLEDVPFDLKEVDELPSAMAAPVPENRQLVDDLHDPNVPSGVLCSTTNVNGTLAPALFDPDAGERFFATSNHIYGDHQGMETAHRGEPLYVVGESERRQVGAVRRGHPDEDLVVVKPGDAHAPGSRIHGATPSRVLGQFTKAGLAELKARGAKLQKVGGMSGRSTGEIHGIDGVTCFNRYGCRDGQLRWGEETDMTDGDSGSVSYHPDPERPDRGVLVAGLNNARTWWPGGDYVWGTAAYHIRDVHGYHF